MKRLFDIINVVDVEATCWTTNNPNNVMEIIEIGITPYTVATGKIGQKESILVRNDYSEISQFCTELTGHTQADIDAKGIPFKDACDILVNKYGSVSRAWASFGDYDRDQFQKDCRKKGVKYPFGPSHMNVKVLFALKHKETRAYGLPKTLERIGEKIDGRHHNGADDSYNIAKVLKHLLL